jgi:hypothetical protein
MKDPHELAMEQFVIAATWMEKTGGYAKDMTLRDHYAGLAMQAVYEKHWDMFMEETYETSEEVVNGATNDAYALADAMLKERTK